MKWPKIRMEVGAEFVDITEGGGPVHPDNPQHVHKISRLLAGEIVEIDINRGDGVWVLGTMRRLD